MKSMYYFIDKLPSINKETFLMNYYTKERPLLIEEGSMDWPALTKWSEKYFIEKIGNTEVVLNEFIHIKKQLLRTILPQMTMKEAINLMWSNEDQTKKYYILRDSMVNHYPELLEDIKDISLVDQNTFFSKDLWFGDGGNITPIHFDAVDNFVVPIFGTKTFYLYPPTDAHFLYSHNIASKGRFNFCQIASRFLVDQKRYPLFTQAKCYKVIIKPGNILFIPIGWWHEVHTHTARAASITYFFNNRQHKSLLSFFLGYQSCRLHEIKDDNIVQNILYETNYKNWFTSALKLIEKKQWWLGAILAGAALEGTVLYSVSIVNMSLFDVIIEKSEEPICISLVQNKGWIEWKEILELAITEKNHKLAAYDLTQFIYEIREFIESSIQL